MNTVLPSNHHTESFATRILAWYKECGRHDLPWQVQDPYIVWVSEVMLQQTQVKTVIPYFKKFMAEFPTVHDLAAADWEQVANLWAGLGYYARARNLHKSAKTVSNQLKLTHNYPTTLEQWQALSGIGQSTAGAIMSMGLGAYGVILDGNVKRVLTRYFAIKEDVTKSACTKHLWQLAEQLTPIENNRSYTQAIMDLGATLCTRSKPSCLLCPVQENCEAFAEGEPTNYPVKKKKKPIPTRTATVLVLKLSNPSSALEENTEKWLWIQRPDSGLWGGLWCLPFVDDKQITHDAKTELGNAIENNEFTELCHAIFAGLGKAVEFETDFKPIKHTFSHFHWLLNTKVYSICEKDFERINNLLQHSSMGYQWCLANTNEKLALPKAMLKVIKSIT